MKIMPVVLFLFFFFSQFFTNNPNVENPSSGITRQKQNEKEKNHSYHRRMSVEQVVNFVVENDHKLGCAARTHWNIVN